MLPNTAPIPVQTPQEKAPRVRKSRQPVQRLETEWQPSDDELCTVLYGYGRVPPDKVSWLDDYEVRGGVIKEVPYSIAKHWKAGTRPDGKRPQGRVSVIILPADATEADYMKAAGVTSSDLAKLTTLFSREELDALFNKLTPQQLSKVRQMLSAQAK
jgi:hypothetical protein